MELESVMETPSYFTEKRGSEVGTDQGGDGGSLILNGYTNGISENHQKEHKEKVRDKDREKDKDRHKDRDRERDKDREKDRDRHKDKYKDKEREKDRDKERDKHKHSSSSSSKDKDKHSSSSSSKDKDRDKHKDHKSSSSSSNKDKESDREKEKSRDKEKERERDKEKDKSKDHKSSSSSSKDKDKHSSSKDKDRDRDKERDKLKSSSSSSHKDKEKSSSSKDKVKSHSSSSSSSKDKHRDGSVSLSDKDKRSGSDKDKHREKDKDKYKEKERDKDRDREREKKAKERDHEHKVKSEPSAIENDSQERQASEAISENRPEIKFEFPEIKHEPIDESYVDGNSSQDSTTFSQHSLKIDLESDDDVPLVQRTSGVVKKEKRKQILSDDDDIPLTQRKKVKTAPQKKRKAPDYDDEEDFKPAKKKKLTKKPVKQEVKKEVESPKKGRKAQEDTHEVWKWWEEDKREDGVKWTFLEHKGPVFAPDYERVPPTVKFFYDGKEVKLSESAEEVAGFYARMLEHDYTTKDAFNKNFFKDWRKQMTEKEKSLITDLSKCDFTQLHNFFKLQSEERKNMSKEEKKKIKEKNEEMMKEYGVCTIDGHKEKIGNFKIEPPGLFRGRGEHPKMGMLKRRVMPEDVIINCSKDSDVPKSPHGHKWKEVRHDNSVTWLACWVENVQGQTKYVMLNPSSKLKGEKDWQKYETARTLAKRIDKIRENYRSDWKSKEMRIRQRAVALYFIDKLALRAGNEKDEDQADTVGCCSLRVEHITLHEEKDGKEFVVEFDFLGKDSIRYYNNIPVEKRVFKNLQLFMENKAPGDDLFDRLNTTVLNKHLNELMEGLTAKVFRTYNASITLQQQLNQLTDPDDSIAAKILSYNRANRAVAILCNHQRAVPKTHAKSMENLQNKIQAKRDQVEEAERQLKIAKRESKHSHSAKDSIAVDKRKKALERLREQLMKLEVSATDKEENKEIALGTSKLNYLDPRISVAWCKKYNVPIEKIYNKTQRDKFRWAIDMAGADYVF